NTSGPLARGRARVRGRPPGCRTVCQTVTASCSDGLPIRPTEDRVEHMLGIRLNPRQFLDRVAEELGRIDEVEVQALADAVWECYQHGATVFLCGNGGSGSNASHFCEDLGKGTLKREDFDNDKKKRLRVLSLTDNTPYLLAWGNDE